jgi:hypothetical protein
VVIVVVLAVAAGYIWWRVQQGPVSLSLISGRLESAINARLKGVSIKIRDAILERDERAKRIRFRLRGLELKDKSGTVIARAPRAALGLKGDNILTGDLTPVRLTLIGPNILLTRRLDGGLELGISDKPAVPDQAAHGKGDRKAAGKPVKTGPAKPKPAKSKAVNPLMGFLLDTLSGDQKSGGGYSALEDISVRDATLTLRDALNRTVWFAPRANLIFQRAPAGVSVLADAEIEAGKHPWKIQMQANYSRSNGNIHIVADIKDLVPADIAAKIPWLGRLAEVRLPLTGRAVIDVGDDGILRHAEGRLSAGAGFVAFPGVIPEHILVDEGVIGLAYTPSTGDILITDSALFIGRSKAELKGVVSPQYDKTGRIKVIAFDLLADNVNMATGPREAAARAVAIDSVNLSGLADIENEQINIEAFNLKAGAARMFLTAQVKGFSGVPAIKVQGKLKAMPFALIKELWPPAAAAGAREWLVDNLIRGTVEEADLKADITRPALTAALDGKPLPNDQIDFTFKVADVATRYLEQMPPIRNAIGRGHLRGDAFTMTLATGAIQLPGKSRLALSQGRFHVTNLAKKGTVSRISVVATGPTPTLARLVDHKPLGYISEFGLKPTNLKGSARIKLDLDLPLLKDLPFALVELRAGVGLKNLKIKNLKDNLSITGGDFDMVITKTGLTGSGGLEVNGIKAKVDWREDFDKSKKITSRIKVAAAMNDRARAKIGFNVADMLRGPTKVTLTAAGRGGNYPVFRVRSDMTRARLTVDQLSWTKPPGIRAHAEFDLKLPKGGDIVIDRLKVTGQDIKATGKIHLDSKGRIKRIDLPAVNLGRLNRLSVRIKPQAPGVLGVTVRGRSLDLKPMLANKSKRRPVANPRRRTAGSLVVVDAQIAKLFGHDNESLSNVKARLTVRGGSLLALKLASQFADRSPLTISSTRDSVGRRLLVARSPNGGRALRLAGIYSKIVGGQLRLDVNLGKAGNKGGSAGRLRIDRFVIRNENALKSLTSGVPQRSADGRRRFTINAVRFDRLNVPFTLQGDRLTLKESIIRGPSIGATARGVINTRTDQLAVRGTLIPVYALNSFLGNVPILGQVLVGGKGQGLFGVTFQVTGTLDKPKFSANPISALAPGFLRRLFDPPGPGRAVGPQQPPTAVQGGG